MSVKFNDPLRYGTSPPPPQSYQQNPPRYAPGQVLSSAPGPAPAPVRPPTAAKYCASPFSPENIPSYHHHDYNTSTGSPRILRGEKPTNVMDHGIIRHAYTDQSTYTTWAPRKIVSGYMAAYLRHLQEHPLQSKMFTSATLASLQELLASWIARDRGRYGNYFTARVPKMALYGFFISAPMGHAFVNIMQWLFAGHTGVFSRFLQILFSNLIVSPIQNSLYLVFMALIAGAKTYHQVRATVKAGFMPVMRVSWISSPICLAFAQRFLPYHLWVPFFNLVAFIIGTYINVHTKQKRLAALRKKHYGDPRYSSSSGKAPIDPTSY